MDTQGSGRGLSSLEMNGAPLPSVSLILPTRDEASNIDALLHRVAEALDGWAATYEIIVADGGSTDGTVEQARAWASVLPIRVMECRSGRGLAGDVLEAASSAAGDVVVVMDADLSHPAEKIPALAEPVLAGEQDMMIGSRWVPGGGAPGWPWRRRVMSRVASALAWPIVDARDPLSGFFAIRRDRLMGVDLGASGFKIGLEALASGPDMRVGEVPIQFVDRVAGASKMGVDQITAYVRRLVHLMGGSVSRRSAGRFGAVGAAGMVVDFAAFTALDSAGVGLGPAHLTSFGLATLLNFVLNARWVFGRDADRRAIAWRTLVAFVAVALLALFLRGGVLALTAGLWEWPASVAMVFAVGVVAGVNYFGRAFYVFPNEEARRRPELRWRVAAVGVVGYVVALRLVYMGLIDLMPEEAYYWNYAQHLDIGYLDHPPMVAWLIALSQTVFGISEFSIRLGALACWVMAAGFVFALTRRMFGKSAGLCAVLLFSVFPMYFGSGLVMTPDAPLIACWAGALYFLARALLDGRGWAWIGVGVCIGLGMVSKYSIALLAPATLCFVLMDPRSRRWLLRPEVYAGAAIALALFSPVIVWNARNGWASFAFQGTRRLGEQPEFSLHLLAGYAALMLTPVGLAAVVGAIAWSGRNMVDLSIATAERRRALFIAVYTLIPLAVFVVFSLRHEVKFNWTGPVWLAVIPAAAWRLSPAEFATGVLAAGPRRRGVWAPTVLAMMLFYGAGLHYITLGVPGVGYPSKFRLPVGWEELGEEVTRLDHELERETGFECLLIGLDRYFITSQLAYYDREDGVREAVGRHLVNGRTSLMYERWFEGSALRGMPAVLVTFDRRKLTDRELEARFDRLGPIESREVVRGGRVVGSFYYRAGYGYRPGGDLDGAIPSLHPQAGSHRSRSG